LRYHLYRNGLELKDLRNPFQSTLVVRECYLNSNFGGTSSRETDSVNPHTPTIVFAFIIVVVASVPAFSQKSDGTDGTIFLGPSFAFVLKEPTGWVVDSQTAKSQHLEAVLYREGSSWKDAVAVMYARVIYKDKIQNTVEQVITDDVTDFLKLNKESTVTDSPPLRTRYKNQAISKVFYDAANRNYELVAFIDEPKVVVILVLSSRNKGEYEKAVPAFKSLVASYFVFTPLVGPQ
jgi:hypothetical protein